MGRRSPAGNDTHPWAIFRAHLDGVAALAADAVVPPLDRSARRRQLVESLRIGYGHLGLFGIHPKPRAGEPLDSTGTVLRQRWYASLPSGKPH